MNGRGLIVETKRSGRRSDTGEGGEGFVRVGGDDVVDRGMGGGGVAEADRWR